MKKILFLIPHLEKTSPVTQLLGLITHLDKNKYYPVVLSFFKERPKSMRKEFEGLGIKVICGELDRWEIHKQKKLLQNTIQSEKPDIVHSCSVITDGICSYCKTNCRLVLTLHSYIYEDVIERYGKIIGGFFCKCEESAIQKANAVVTCSITLAEKYGQRFQREFIPIQNGIEVSQWAEGKEEDKKSLRKRLGLPIDSFIVLSTNKIDSIKDPRLLIQAFKESNFEDAYLIMLGDGNYEKECKELASNNIIFTGRVSNVKDYLYSADVLVSASKSEGLPYAILEAACTGIRMILSDIPQHQEVMGKSDGVQYFHVGAKEELKGLLAESLFNRSRVAYDISSFTASSMSQKYQDVYDGLLK